MVDIVCKGLLIRKDVAMKDSYMIWNPRIGDMGKRVATGFPTVTEAQRWIIRTMVKGSQRVK